MNNETLLLLEEKSINDRTLVCWYDSLTGEYSICLFNIINLMKDSGIEKSYYFNWGYAVKYIRNMFSPEECSQVASLYLQDMEKGDFWWEEETE